MLQLGGRGCAARARAGACPRQVGPRSHMFTPLDVARALDSLSLRCCLCCRTPCNLGTAVGARAAPHQTAPPGRPAAHAGRSVLSAYLAGSPHPRSLLFERNSHGKPRLVRPSATPAGHTLRFNLTHTPSLIGLAVTGGHRAARPSVQLSGEHSTQGSAAGCPCRPVLTETTQRTARQGASHAAGATAAYVLGPRGRLACCPA